jgi:hypothetical protein
MTLSYEYDIVTIARDCQCIIGDAPLLVDTCCFGGNELHGASITRAYPAAFQRQMEFVFRRLVVGRFLSLLP